MAAGPSPLVPVAGLEPARYCYQWILSFCRYSERSGSEFPTVEHRDTKKLIAKPFTEHHMPIDLLQWDSLKRAVLKEFLTFGGMLEGCGGIKIARSASRMNYAERSSPAIDE